MLHLRYEVTADHLESAPTMPWIKRPDRYYQAAVLYFIPFLAVVFTDIVLFDRGPFAFPNDALPGMFGLGLGWVTAAPLRVFHIPGIAFQQLSGLMAWALGPTETSLQAFNNTGVLLQLTVAAVAAVWAGRICVDLRLGAPIIILLGCITAFMPTMVLYSSIWTMYYPLGVLIVPISLTLYAAIVVSEPNPVLSTGSLAALGFLCANIYTGLILAVATVLALIAAMPRPADLATRFIFPLSHAPGRRIVTAVAITAPLISVLTAIAAAIRPARAGRAAIVDLQWWILILAACIAGLFLLTAILTPPAEAILSGIAAPILLGWAAGANVLLPWWLLGGAHAFLFKGGAAPRYPVRELISRVDVIDYLAAASWHWFLLFALGAGLIATIAAWPQKATESRRARFVALFTLAALFLNVLSAADVTFAAPSPPAHYYGQTSRYFLMMTGPVAVALVWLCSGSSLRRRLALFSTALLCFGSFTEYCLITPRLVSEKKRTSRHVDRLINDHLAEDSTHAVMCAHTVLPERCALLYGYNNYRSVESRARLDRQALADGRIIYLYPPDLHSTLAEAMARHGDIMVVRESNSVLASGGVPVWRNRLVTVELLSRGVTNSPVKKPS